MFAIIGATGKVGYTTSQALRQANHPVEAILRDVTKAEPLRKIGCEIAVADLEDANALTKAIGNADAVQVILPPSPTAKDGAQHMRTTFESIATALEQSKPKRFLVISDYGAHVDHDIGMPTMYRAFENRLSGLSGHKIILRSAEHMQNWGRVIPAAMASGTLSSFHDPVEVPFPTISAPDLGLIAADILMRPSAGAEKLEIFHAEGPHRYSANDVANALSELLNRPVKAAAVPRTQWKEILQQGLSPSLAELLIKTNDAQNKPGVVEVEENAGEVRYGTTELIDALRTVLPRP